MPTSDKKKARTRTPEAVECGPEELDRRKGWAPAEVKTVRLAQVVQESQTVWTVRFPMSCGAEPGQFVMVWVPGVDAFPMSLSYMPPEAGVTFKVLGEGTKALAALRPGSVVGITGPLGRPYRIAGGETIVAGGTGIASVAPAVELAVERERASTGKAAPHGDGNAGHGHGAGALATTVMLGARTESELFFRKRLEASGARVLISTDDGSCGEKCFVTDLLAREIAQARSVVTCGPEVMMVKVVDACGRAEKPVQASLERHMKCGVGVCDACSCSGRLVCRYGPVFTGEELARMDEFGSSKRDASGRLVPFRK